MRIGEGERRIILRSHHYVVSVDDHTTGFCVVRAGPVTPVHRHVLSILVTGVGYRTGDAHGRHDDPRLWGTRDRNGPARRKDHEGGRHVGDRDGEGVVYLCPGRIGCRQADIEHPRFLPGVADRGACDGRTIGLLAVYRQNGAVAWACKFELPRVGDRAGGVRRREAVRIEGDGAPFDGSGVSRCADRWHIALHRGGVVLPIVHVVDGGGVGARTIGHAGGGVYRGARTRRGREVQELIAVGGVAQQPGVLLVAVPVGVGDVQRLHRLVLDEPRLMQPGRGCSPGGGVRPGDRGRGVGCRRTRRLYQEEGVGGAGRRDRRGIEAIAGGPVNGTEVGRPNNLGSVVARLVKRCGQRGSDEQAVEGGPAARSG